jgi:hypothetical protein
MANTLTMERVMDKFYAKLSKLGLITVGKEFLTTAKTS